ncbi:hypothetical protein [Rhodanobacter sp. PCA2]|uniref:hypothetical protein n=1 Tax=Rhodanobacter sp. PCA2 TaxID=2006117 RepID=UPI0015E79682|nr:hypothetical protein [Rhodanobacter sp. PCA2]MBA2079838.1 hypothetical protein [Rhodanobacter sp. PCA2]
MALLEGRVQEQLLQLQAWVEKTAWGEAYQSFRELLDSASLDQLRLLQPTLRGLVDQFHKRKRRDLTELLDQRLEPPAPIECAALLVAWQNHLDGLRDKHIFQWNTFYRERMNYILQDAYRRLHDAPERAEVIDGLKLLFARHSTDIYTRGYAHACGRGLAIEVVHAKSIHGLRQFLYLLMALLAEHRNVIRKAHDAALSWDLISMMIVGVLQGYADASFDDVPGAALLAQDLTSWLPALGFVRGSEALELLASHPGLFDEPLRTVVPALLAVQHQTSRVMGDQYVLPRLSRVGINVPRLDLIYSIDGVNVPRDLLVCCYYNGTVDDTRLLDDSLALRAALTMATLDKPVREWVDKQGHEQVIDASATRPEASDIESLAELAAVPLGAYLAIQPGTIDASRIVTNHARDFPLDEPQSREQLTVERYSVRKVFQDLQRGIGVFVWCSVRRSGKTTAARRLAEMGPETQVIYQTMDHQPAALDQNIFERRVSQALTAGKMVEPHFFESIVAECQQAHTRLAPAKKQVFLLDEYESLFGLLLHLGNRDPLIRYVVAQPLLSQMLAFSQKNVLIFMGQRPDAHAIFLAQNQLTPNVREHSFPLFSHEHAAEGAEFNQFLRNVLSPRLPFTAPFADAVYQETNGHPYLTVNLMTDFCDWLIVKQAHYPGEGLQAHTYKDFARECLTVGRLARSPHYGLFQNMLAEYLGEQCCHDTPWLYAITGIVRDIAQAHPQKLRCTAMAYRGIAAKYTLATNIMPDRLLAQAKFANFLREHGGQVLLGIPLMGRLAASVMPRIN